MEEATWPARPLVSRRRILALAAAAAAAVVAACGSNEAGTAATPAPAGPTVRSADTTPATIGTVPIPTDTVAVNTRAASNSAANASTFGGGGGDGTLKIGFTAPLTGALAAFGEANSFIVDAMSGLTADGLMIGDKSYSVQIIQKDVQSNPDIAATCAAELITENGVDLVLATATTGLVSPVADQCEANGVPCLSTLAPWQPYFFGRGGDPTKGFDWTYHFFWGADQLVAVFAHMWDSVDTNKTVGLLCSNDADANALADPVAGFPAGASAAGYTVVDPGLFETPNNDFSSIIAQMKDGGVEIVCGVSTAQDFATFWTQAEQQGFHPKLVTMAEALSFPSTVEMLGDSGDGLATAVAWSADHPFISSLTAETATQLSDAYEASSGIQSTEVLGFVHALFEVCFDVVSRAGSTDKQAIAQAAAATSLDTVVGPVAYANDDLPRSIGRTPLVGGQWRKQTGGAFPFELLVVDNTQSPEIPTSGQLQPLQ